MSEKKDPRDNLRPKPWKPGQSGNPAGRPKGSRNKSTILREILALTYKDHKGRTRQMPFESENKAALTVEEMIDLKLVKLALNGNLGAIQEIKDIVYGKNPDIVVGDPEKPVSHSIVNTDLKGQALIDELKRRGLPTSVLEE